MKPRKEPGGAYVMAFATLFVGGAIISVGTWGQVSDLNAGRAVAQVSQLVAFDQGKFWTFFAALFAIMNPMIAVPLFVHITRGRSAGCRRRLATVSSSTVLLALVTAAVLGQELLGFFAISIGGFRIAGGVIVLLMGLSMLQSKAGELGESGEPDAGPAASQGVSRAVCPIAFPLLAGPGGIALIILQSLEIAAASDYAMIACAIALMAILTYVTLRLAAPIARALGPTGLMAATRLIGIVAAAIAVDMMVVGLRHCFPTLL